VYTRKSRLSRAKRFRLFEHFVAGTAARVAAGLVGVNRNTVNRFHLTLRQIIAEEMEKAAPLHGEAEVHESYFGGWRKGKEGTRSRRESAGLRSIKARQTRLHVPDCRRQGKDAHADPQVPGGVRQHRLCAANFASNDEVAFQRTSTGASTTACPRQKKGGECRINGIENIGARRDTARGCGQDLQETSVQPPQGMRVAFRQWEHKDLYLQWPRRVGR